MPEIPPRERIDRQERRSRPHAGSAPVVTAASIEATKSVHSDGVPSLEVVGDGDEVGLNTPPLADVTVDRLFSGTFVIFLAIDF